MKILKTHDGHLTADQLQEVRTVISSGGIVAFPTETVYGVGCDASQESAVKRIYEVKGRDFNKPLAFISVILMC